MLDIYLSDKAIRDLKRYANQAFHSLEALSNAIQQFTSIENFVQQTRIPQNHEIKRLRCDPMAWRHHDGDFRTVFTTSAAWGVSSAAIVVLRIAHRARVYRELDSYLQPRSLELWQSSEPDEDSLTDEQLSKEQALERYAEDSSRSPRNRLRIHQLKGAAGTGKTTFAFELAIEAVNQGVYPIIVVPNVALQNFGTKVVRESLQQPKICINLRTKDPTDLAILTKDHLLQHLTGDSEEALSNAVGNALIRETLRNNNVQIPDYLENINLYSLYLGIVADAYNTSQRDPLLRELSNLGAVSFIENPRHRRFFQRALQERDAATQANRIQGNWLKFVEVMTQLVGTSDEQDLQQNLFKFPILIIDEVQDFYWSQLKAILRFYRVCLPLNRQVSSNLTLRHFENELKLSMASVSQDAGRLVVLAGDNNQRVTFSGFSWANLATTFSHDFPNHDPFDTPEVLNRNYRNTSQIALAANYILSAQRTELKAFKINSGGASWLETPPPPKYCQTQGAKPRLIEADQLWVEQLINRLRSSTEQVDESVRFVFIYNEASVQYKSLWQFFKDISEEIEHLIFLSVAEAKGQEFNSVLIIFPFARCSEEPSLNELFTWYTALTRAKYYVAILISPEEKCWLERQVINPTDLETVFCIEPDLTQDEFVQELYEHGLDTISTEDKINHLVRNLFQFFEKWLQGESPPNYLLAKVQRINYTVLQILDVIEIRANELGEQRSPDVTILQNLSLEVFLPIEALVIYLAILPLLLKVTTHAQTLDSQLISKMESYFQQNPQEVENAQNQVKSPISLCLIYRASQHSWKAAQVLQDCSDDSIAKFLYEQISNDLINRGLPWEANRIRYRYLQQNPLESLPFQELIKESDDDLPNVLIYHLLEEATKFSNQAQ